MKSYIIMCLISLTGCATTQPCFVMREGVRKESQDQISREFASCTRDYGFQTQREQACLYVKGYQRGTCDRNGKPVQAQGWGSPEGLKPMADGVRLSDYKGE